jgi:hypothetical protein
MQPGKRRPEKVDRRLRLCSVAGQEKADLSSDERAPHGEFQRWSVAREASPDPTHREGSP